MVVSRLRSTMHRVFLLLCVLLVAVLARIEDSAVDKDDRRVIVVSTPFGFTTSGRIDILVNKLLVWKPTGTHDADPDELGFILAPSESETQIQLDLLQGNCALVDNPSYVKLFTLKQVRATQTKEQTNGTGDAAFAQSYEVAAVWPNFPGGELSVYYVKCEAEEDYAVSFDIKVSAYNVKGESNDYLSVGDDALPLLYMCLFVLFCVCAALWTVVLLRARPNSHKLHWLMLLLIVLKSLTLLSQAGMYHMISRYGHPEGWNVVYYVFTALRGMLFFTLVILIGTGWSYMRPFVGPREKRVLMIVLPLQLLANVAIVVLDEYTPAARSWFTWRDILHLVDIICCCAVLFPIVWSIKHLRDASQTDGKAARCLQKLQLFRSFYIMVVSYIYFTRIVVYLLRSTLPYNYSWVSEAAAEMATLAFYVLTGVQFRPKSDNPYLALSSEDLDDLEMHPLTGKADD